MKVTWIFEEGGPGLREYVENFVDINPYSCLNLPPIISDPAIFYGTIRAVQHLKNSHSFKYIPGMYFRTKEVDFSSFAGAFGYYLLNSDYIMLPAGDLRKRWSHWCNRLEANKWYSLFVRPNSSLKSFAGGDMRLNEFKECKVEDDKIVVIAKPQFIRREWRLVVVDNKIVAGGQYMEGGSYGECYHTSSCSENVLIWSQTILDTLKYSPDRVWVLDVCEAMDNSIKVVECNCFSTSGLYKIDMSSAVKEIERVAIEEWRDYVS